MSNTIPTSTTTQDWITTSRITPGMVIAVEKHGEQLVSTRRRTGVLHATVQDKTVSPRGAYDAKVRYDIVTDLGTVERCTPIQTFPLISAPQVPAGAPDASAVVVGGTVVAMVERFDLVDTTPAADPGQLCMRDQANREAAATCTDPYGHTPGIPGCPVYVRDCNGVPMELDDAFPMVAVRTDESACGADQVGTEIAARVAIRHTVTDVRTGFSDPTIRKGLREVSAWSMLADDHRVTVVRYEARDTLMSTVRPYAAVLVDGKYVDKIPASKLAHGTARVVWDYLAELASAAPIGPEAPAAPAPAGDVLAATLGALIGGDQADAPAVAEVAPAPAGPDTSITQRGAVRVTLTDGSGDVVQDWTRPTWNGGIRDSERAVREIARQEGAPYSGRKPERTGIPGTVTDTYTRVWASSFGILTATVTRPVPAVVPTQGPATVPAETVPSPGAPIRPASAAEILPALTVRDDVAQGMPYVTDLPDSWSGEVVTLTPTDMGKLLRRKGGFLASWFPGVKFSVRSDWGSTDVRWTGGPAADLVDLVATMWEGKTRDSQAECDHYRGAVLYVSGDGVATAYKLPGTYVHTHRAAGPDDETHGRPFLPATAPATGHAYTWGEVSDPFCRPYAGGTPEEFARHMGSRGVDEWTRRHDDPRPVCPVQRCALATGHPYPGVHRDEYGHTFLAVLPADGGDGDQGGNGGTPTDVDPTGPASAGDQVEPADDRLTFRTWEDLAAWIGGAGVPVLLDPARCAVTRPVDVPTWSAPTAPIPDDARASSQRLDPADIKPGTQIDGRTVRWVIFPALPGLKGLVPEDGGALVTFTDNTQIGVAAVNSGQAATRTVDVRPLYTVTNDAHGRVRVHTPTCRDISRDVRRGGVEIGSHWDVRADHVRDIVLDLYDDATPETWREFLDLEVMPCAGILPEGDDVPAVAEEIRPTITVRPWVTAHVEQVDAPAVAEEAPAPAKVGPVKVADLVDGDRVHVYGVNQFGGVTHGAGYVNGTPGTVTVNGRTKSGRVSKDPKKGRAGLLVSLSANPGGWNGFRMTIITTPDAMAEYVTDGDAHQFRPEAESGNPFLCRARCSCGWKGGPGASRFDSERISWEKHAAPAGDAVRSVVTAEEEDEGGAGTIYTAPMEWYAPQVDSDDDADITIMHDHEDGTVLLGSSKGDGVYEIAKAHGFDWRRNVGIFIPRSRDQFSQLKRIRECADTLRLAGHTVAVTVDDVWRPAAVREEARGARVDARVERLTARSLKQSAASDARREAARQLIDMMPFGEPVKMDHYSAPRHLRAFERIENNQRAAHAAYDYAQHLASRADGAASNEDAKQGPRAIMRRIARLEADQREAQRRLDEAAGARAANSARYWWLNLERITEDIAYQRAKLGDMAETGAFVAWGPEHFVKGDQANIGGRWYPVVRVSAKSLSLDGLYAPGYAERAKWDRVHGRRRDGVQLDTPNGKPRDIEQAKRVERWAYLTRHLTCSSYDRTPEQESKRRHFAQARRVVLGLARTATAQEVDAFGKPTGEQEQHARALAVLAAFERLEVGETFDQVAADTQPIGDTVPAWTMPAGEPERVNVRDLVPGDIVCGVYDNFAGQGERLVSSMVGPVTALPKITDRHESGEWYTLEVDGETYEGKTFRRVAAHLIGAR